MLPEDIKVALTAMETMPTVTTPTHTVITVAATSTEVRAANTARRYLLLVNDSDEVIYVALGTAAALNSGIRINASGGSFELARGAGVQYLGAIYAICASGGTRGTG